MKIPRRERRVRALEEIRRVLRPGARFVFTAHDRGDAGEWRT
jgi:SAM-dependent methyltransferase